jgi:RNA polymerase sigma factor (sigma-70 family)
MEENEWLAVRFEASRGHLRAVAYRMLGSLGDADDAVQECWLRLNRAGTRGVENLEGWLTTVLARICLNMLRSRKSQREEPLGVHAANPVVANENCVDPEHETLLAESVGLALLVVLERLTPSERVAFVLHDVFGVTLAVAIACPPEGGVGYGDKWFLLLHGLPIDSSIDEEVLPPLFEFGNAEPDCAAHHSEMGNLLSLDVRIHQRRTDTKKPRGGLDIDWCFKTLQVLPGGWTFS